MVSRYLGIADGLVRDHTGGMKDAKAMTIRLSRDQADALETLAAIDAQPVAEVIRAAIQEHISARRKDEDFQESLRKRLERAHRLLG